MYNIFYKGKEMLILYLTVKPTTKLKHSKWCNRQVCGVGGHEPDSNGENVGCDEYTITDLQRRRRLIHRWYQENHFTIWKYKLGTLHLPLFSNKLLIV